MVIETPPPAAINGIPGMLGTYCWTSSCADAFWPPPAELLPNISGSLDGRLPDGAANFRWSHLTPDGEERLGLGSMPDGSIISLDVRFPGGFDAHYHWLYVGESGETEQSGFAK